MESFTQTQWPAWAYAGVNEPFSGYAQQPDYPSYLADSMEAYQTHQHHLIHHQQMSRTTECKPRLSKEEVEVLEAEFQKNHKPNSSTKKALAESMRVDNARINNWFQNRRAREKKENNIRQYEARQKLEKEKAEPGAGGRPNATRGRDLVASSAPFPGARRASQPTRHTPDLSSDLERGSETTEGSQYDESDGFASTNISIQDLSRVSPKHEVEADGSRIPDHLSDYLLASSGHETAPPMQGSEMLLDANNKSSDYFFAHLHGLSEPDTGAESAQVFPSHHFPSAPDLPRGAVHQNNQTGYHLDSPATDDSVQSPSTAGDIQLKSPPTIDIASRRNRRPPPLAINSSRSYSGVPKTSFDMTNRAEATRSMRRVASANGSVRIMKPLGTPRSPYDRNAEALLQMSRSPVMPGGNGTVAPPTPNTPPVLSQQQGSGNSSASALITDFKLQSPSLAIRDPTFRTPPTTPGIAENMFSLNSAFEMSLSEDVLITPGLGSFSNDFEIPTMSIAVPEYLAAANDGSSHPGTPSFGPQSIGPGPAYFGFSGGNSEYNWSDASVSAKSSPGQNPQFAHFMNMTPSHFNHG